jgi:hypothetical protein
MKRLGVLVLLCAIERVAIAGPGWSIAWPAEWTDVTQDALNTPDAKARLEQLARAHATSDLAVRVDAEQHVTQVLYVELPFGDDTSTAGPVHHFLDSGREAARRGAREISYRQREAGDTLIADQTLERDGATIYVKWMAGAGHERMHGIKADCNASHSLCATVLASLVLDPTELESLTSYSQREMNRIGLYIGIAVGSLIALLFGRRLRARLLGRRWR